LVNEIFLSQKEITDLFNSGYIWEFKTGYYKFFDFADGIIINNTGGIYNE
jgi:hypothetical protein